MSIGATAGEVTCRCLVRSFFTECKSSRKKLYPGDHRRRPFSEHPSHSESCELLGGTTKDVHHKQVLLKPHKGWRVCVFEKATLPLQFSVLTCQEEAVFPVGLL